MNKIRIAFLAFSLATAASLTSVAQIAPTQTAPSYPSVPPAQSVQSYPPAPSYPSVPPARSEDEAVKVVQSSKYNVFTGNWEVDLDDAARSVTENFKKQMPNLDYHLVEEETVVKKNSERTVLTFRGDGDQRVIVKLKEIPEGTNVLLRVGRAGNEAKSVSLFKYVFMRM